MCSKKYQPRCAQKFLQHAQHAPKNRFHQKPIEIRTETIKKSLLYSVPKSHIQIGWINEKKSRLNLSRLGTLKSICRQKSEKYWGPNYFLSGRIFRRTGRKVLPRVGHTVVCNSNTQAVYDTTCVLAGVSCFCPSVYATYPRANIRLVTEKRKSCILLLHYWRFSICISFGGL